LREVERYVKAADRERMARIDMAAIANVRLATKAIPFSAPPTLNERRRSSAVFVESR